MNRHISEQFDSELQEARDLLMEMGGLVEQQVNDACEALLNQRSELAEKVREVERRVNHLEVELDEHCVQIIARRQPTASDLRMMISVMNASTDLERIGDEAERIAKMALAASEREYPDHRYPTIAAMNLNVSRMVSDALDAFARTDAEAAVLVVQADNEVDIQYRDTVRLLIEHMQSHPDDIELTMNIMWVARALERIGDHAKNISEYVVYLVRGEDVRHVPRQLAR